MAGRLFTTRFESPKRQPWYRIAAPAIALAATLSTLVSPAGAQVLYRNIDTPSTDNRNNAPAYLNSGPGFVVDSTRNGGSINTLVTQMMSDDLKLNGNNLADVVVQQLAVVVTNSNVGVDMVIRPHIRIYDDNHPTPTPPYPPPVSPNPPNNDSPGTLLKTVDLGNFVVPGATANANRPIAGSAILNVDSVTFGALNLPMTNTKYWFGIFFDIDVVAGVDLAVQRERLGRIGLGLYNSITIGDSGDVHHETDRFATGDRNGNGTIDADEVGFPNYQRNYFNSSFADGDPNGTYVQARNFLNGQAIPSNFGWLVGGFIVPEPSGFAFALLGIPALALIARRRR